MTNTGTTNVRLSPPPPELMRLIVGGAPVTVTHRGHVRHGRAVLVDAAPSQVGAALRAAMDDGARPFELGLKITRGYDPTADDLAVIARSIIRVDFED
ncbi:hypothetical protein ACFWPX_16125 [Nocardia sp. NPDC058518]|uniref:hypothetical protein n=1 Tax=Nocardia sp. NPDC058518 TaxID=3346534 RepID=UPI0036695AD6